jgi:hypothetical protein
MSCVRLPIEEGMYPKKWQTGIDRVSKELRFPMDIGTVP